MLDSYIFEVIFMALCFLSFLPFFKIQLQIFAGGTHTRNHYKKTMDTFLDAATFFSLWVGIAPYSSLSNFDYSSRFTVAYEFYLLQYVALLTLGGLYVSLAFSYRKLCRRKQRCRLITLTSLLTCILCLQRVFNENTQYGSWFEETWTECKTTNIAK
jgi:hypothetical protein